MAVPRKILIRVIGAPLLVAALCGLIYWGHRVHASGAPNLPLTLLVIVVVFTGALEFQTMCRIKGFVTAELSTRLSLILMLFIWGALPAPLIKIASPALWTFAIVTVFVLFILCKTVFRYG